MKICVNEILQEGLDVEKKISAKELGLETEHVHYLSDVDVRARIQREKDIVTASCSIKAREKRRCSRCLKEFTFLFEKDEDFVYTLHGEHTLELNDDIKDVIMLDYPIKQLCSPGCKGLCPYCGRDLNESSCGCKEKKGAVCRD